MIPKTRVPLLIGVSFFHTMAHIYPYVLPILCQVIREEIPMDYTRAAILSMMIVIVTIPLTLVFGFIGDRIIKWRLELIIFGSLVGLSYLFIIYFAQTYSALIGAAVLGGVGASVFHPIALPLLSQEFKADRNVAHSVNLIFGTIGSIITPIVSIALSEWLGWRATSIIFGISGVIIAPFLATFILLGKRKLEFIPKPTVVLEENAIVKNNKHNNIHRLFLPFLTGPFIALSFVMIIRSGTFRIMNTFTAFIFEDRFGASKFVSALIMSFVLGMGGVSALISGFVSRRIGSLKTFLWAKAATTIASLLVVIFIAFVVMYNLTLGLGLILVAVLIFSSVTIAFYFGSPSSNSLFAEMVPLKILSSVNGLVETLTIGFSAIAPVVFGAIVDQGYSFPYEYIVFFTFALIPLVLLIYIRVKIGYKTPKEIEDTREEREKN